MTVVANTSGAIRPRRRTCQRPQCIAILEVGIFENVNGRLRSAIDNKNKRDFVLKSSLKKGMAARLLIVPQGFIMSQGNFN